MLVQQKGRARTWVQTVVRGWPSLARIHDPATRRPFATAAAHVTVADAEKIRLLVESARVRLAYAHDRHFAVSLSGIRTRPHQIEAVYLKSTDLSGGRGGLEDSQGSK
jgi:hypothetical protein